MTRIGIVVAVALAASRAAAVDVSSCGQAVPDGETGVLQADLDCSADPAVTLGNRSTLDMNGHAIVARHIGVSCGSDSAFARCDGAGMANCPEATTESSARTSA